MIRDGRATLQFLGASGTVTGSRFLLESAGRQVLLDCGLFQGGGALRRRNWEPPSFRPSDLDAVVLSHAHLDHSGYLPVLAREGFHGPVHCTAGTRDLLKVLLPDAAKLEEEQASHANRHGWSRHSPALPLFTSEDAQAALALLSPRAYHEPWEAAPGVRGRLLRAGHILGSAIVEIDLEDGSRIVHTGDLGRRDQPILRDPETVERADYLLVESTYGDRLHVGDPERDLERVVREAAERGGALLVPAFAVGRAQILIWLLGRMQQEGRIPEVPVYVDSPMANRVSEATCRHDEDLDEEMRAAMDAKRCPICCKRFHLVTSAQESKALNDIAEPLVVIAGSGMATGGRILHHLANRLPDPRTTVLFAGFQAEGTLGRLLLEGAGEVRIHGRTVHARAKIERIDGLSAHADQAGIVAWLRGFRAPPRRTFVVHGEPGPARALAARIEAELGWSVSIPEHGQRFDLEGRA